MFRRGPSLAPVVSATATHMAVPSAACGDAFEGETLAATLYHHAGHPIAIVQRSGATTAMSVVVDGMLGAAPRGRAEPARLPEPDATLGAVVETRAPDGTSDAYRAQF